MAFGFKEQLQIGKLGEKFIADYSPTEFLWKEKNKDSDVIPLIEIPEFGLVFPELKTDDSSKAKELFDKNEDPNYFIERISNDVEKKDGGPWQAKQKGFPIYMYLYWYKKLLYIFNTEKLINRTEEVTLNTKRKLYPVLQKGGRYRSSGYIMKSHEVQDLAILVNMNEPGQKIIPLFEKLLK